MEPDLVAVMDALHTVDVESYISLRKFEIPGVPDMDHHIQWGMGSFFFFPQIHFLQSFV